LCLSLAPVFAEEAAERAKPAKAVSAKPKANPAKVNPFLGDGVLPNVIKKPIVLDADAEADLEYIRKHTQPGVPYVLNLAHPAQLRHVLRAMTRAGDTPERSPQLHARLRALASATPLSDEALAALAPVPAVTDVGTLVPINTITDLANAGGGVYGAAALSSVNGGTQKTDIVTTLYGFDSQKHHVVFAAAVDGTNTAGAYFQTRVTGTNPFAGQNPTTEAEAMFAYVAANATKPEPTVVYYFARDTINPTTTCMNLPQYCTRDASGACIPGQYQSACTNNVKNTTPIKACWNRSSQKECDYWTAGAHPETYFFPLRGSTTFSSPIYKSDSGPIGVTTIYLVVPSLGGGCYMVSQQLAPLGAGWTVTNNDMTLNFDFPSSSFPNTNQCIGSGSFDTNLLVQVDGLVLQNGQYGTFRFNSDRALLGQPGVSTIPQITIQDGCFAAGTLIGMAGGEEKAIESVALGDSVRTADGKIRTVRDITSGIEPKPMIRIHTADKRTLLVTETHPLATRGEPVMAKNLKLNQEIRLESGVTHVVGLSTEKFDGKVYNLRIGDDADAKAGLTMLVANGVAAGDVAAQQLIERQSVSARLTDATASIEQIHPDWRIDFARHHLDRF